MFKYSEPGFYNIDCMEALKEFPDKFFQLAICDPPYQIDGLKKRDGTKLRSRLRKYGSLSQANNSAPGEEYFRELFRVSEHQIIFGGNYFSLPPCRCFIAWYKHQPVKNYSNCEYAWTNFDRPARLIDLPYFGSVGKDKQRIHPTQKPVKLYETILDQYANEGDRILDTHVGSASSLIACYNKGYSAWGFEIDKEFYDKANERLNAEKSQITINDLVLEKGNV